MRHPAPELAHIPKEERGVAILDQDFDLCDDEFLFDRVRVYGCIDIHPDGFGSDRDRPLTGDVIPLNVHPKYIVAKQRARLAQVVSRLDQLRFYFLNYELDWKKARFHNVKNRWERACHGVRMVSELYEQGERLLQKLRNPRVVG